MTCFLPYLYSRKRSCGAHSVSLDAPVFPLHHRHPFQVRVSEKFRFRIGKLYFGTGKVYIAYGADRDALPVWMLPSALFYFLDLHAFMKVIMGREHVTRMRAEEVYLDNHSVNQN